MAASRKKTVTTRKRKTTSKALARVDAYGVIVAAPRKRKRTTTTVTVKKSTKKKAAPRCSLAVCKRVVEKAYANPKKKALPRAKAAKQLTAAQRYMNSFGADFYPSARAAPPPFRLNDDFNFGRDWTDDARRHSLAAKKGHRGAGRGKKDHGGWFDDAHRHSLAAKRGRGRARATGHGGGHGGWFDDAHRHSLAAQSGHRGLAHAARGGGPGWFDDARRHSKAALLGWGDRDPGMGSFSPWDDGRDPARVKRKTTKKTTSKTVARTAAKRKSTTRSVSTVRKTTKKRSAARKHPVHAKNAAIYKQIQATKKRLKALEKKATRGALKAHTPRKLTTGRDFSGLRPKPHARGGGVGTVRKKTKTTTKRKTVRRAAPKKRTPARRAPAMRPWGSHPGF